MATFPSAAAQIQPPPSAVDQAAKLLSLKSLLQQQQLQQAQLAGEQQRQSQAAQLFGPQLSGAQTQAQMGQIQLDNQKRLQAALSDDHLDFGAPGAVNSFIQKGGPLAIPMVAQLTDIANKQAAISNTLLQEHVKKLDQYRGQLMSVIGGDPASKGAAWKQIVDGAVASGDLQPGQVPDAYPGDKQATALANTLALGSVLATEKAQQTRADAAQSQALTASSRLAFEQDPVAQQKIASAKAAGAAQGQLATAQPLATAKAAGEIQGQMQGLGAAGNLKPIPVGPQAPADPSKAAPQPGLFGAVPGQRDEAALSTINPSLASTVRALDEGRLQIPSSFALRSPYWQGVLGILSRYDPTFDAVNYNARAQTRRDFTSGKAAQQVNALNTAIGHLAQLSTAADALGNTSLTPYNTLKNWLSQKSGDPKLTNFQAVVKPVADELTRVWRGTGGSEADIQNRLDALSASNSPEQLHGAIRQLGELMQSKIGALQNQYQQGMGVTNVNMLTPEAQATLGKLEGKSSGTPSAGQFAVTAPNGQVFHFKSQADADAFKKAAGGGQ